MSSCRLLYSSQRACHSEIEIRNLFERHIKTLLDHKWKMIDEINEWGNNLIRRIQENIDKQKLVLEQEHKNQIQCLHLKHQEYLDTASVHEERKNREEVRQLLEQCHVLKFELGTLEYPEQPIPFIQIRIEQQPIEVEQNSFNSRIAENRLMINDKLRIKDSTSAHVIASPTSTSASSNRINDQIWPSSTHYNPLTTDDTHRNSNVSVTEKCPICFMIFPTTMQTNERSQHVNQHFGDS